jgi:hypothetical protein
MVGGTGIASFYDFGVKRQGRKEMCCAKADVRIKAQNAMSTPEERKAAAAILGRAKSEKKAAQSRKNGKKGGRKKKC